MRRLALVVAAVAALALSVGGVHAAGAAALDRVFGDRPDEAIGPQLHIIYAVPSDRPDAALDTNGTIAAWTATFNDWFAAATGGVRLRVDTFAGQPDVSFLKLPETDAALTAQGAFANDMIFTELRVAGFSDPDKIYAVVEQGGNNGACGWGGGGRPLGVLYLEAAPSGRSCGTIAWPFVLGHETLPCARSGRSLRDALLRRARGRPDGGPDVPVCVSGHAAPRPRPRRLLRAARRQPSACGLRVLREHREQPVPDEPSLLPALRHDQRQRSRVVTRLLRLHAGAPRPCAPAVQGGIDLPLVAVPDHGFHFVAWSGAGCSGSGDCSSTLAADAAVTATFAANPTARIAIAGQGRVVAGAAGTCARAACSLRIAYDRATTLRAVPAKHWHFVGWAGACRERRPPAASRRSRASACALRSRAPDPFDLVAHPARREVVVDDAAGLHRGPHGRRADEAEAGGLQLLRELLRLRRLRVPVGRRRGARSRRRERPHELVQRRARLAQLEHAARVRDRRLDLAAVPHDARVAEQALHVALGEARDDVGVEARERAAEVLALAQDRQPREARLEALRGRAARRARARR